MTFLTAEAATASIIANGYHLTESGDFYAKIGMTHGDEPHQRVSLCSVRHNSVDPKWGSPDYFTVEFA